MRRRPNCSRGGGWALVAASHVRSQECSVNVIVTGAGATGNTASATGGRSGAAADGAPSVHCTSHAFAIGASGADGAVPCDAGTVALVRHRNRASGRRVHRCAGEARMRGHGDLGESDAQDAEPRGEAATGAGHEPSFDVTPDVTHGRGPAA